MQKLFQRLSKFIPPNKLAKWMMYWSPMYKRSTGRVTNISPDFTEIDIEIKLSYKNRNIAGVIFGGSLFAATDPIFMLQLMQMLGNKYIVWDRAAEIQYKRPATPAAYAKFILTKEDLKKIIQEVNTNGETNIAKTVHLTSKDGNTIFAEVTKTMYIADKGFYKKKIAERAKK